MLEVYPIAATAENWVHETICAKIRDTLVALNEGGAAPSWTAGNHELLRDRVGLANRYTAFSNAAQVLSQPQRLKTLAVLEAQNNIPAIFDGATACPRVDALPLRIRQPVKDLFEAGFDALKALGVRDRQYAAIFAVRKWCPFCGIEPYEAPGLAREDLDHYLPRKSFPFAAVNLRNLAPMGGKCNSSYKGSQEVIYDNDGLRRRCFDPYGQERAEVSLLRSRPFSGEIVDFAPLPAWEIDLVGDQESVATWDQVFSIRRRYEAKVNAHFRDWTQDFAVWCSQEVGFIDTQQEVVAALDRYLGAIIVRSYGEAIHLKRAMFEMMRERTDSGESAERLTAWFSSLVRAQRHLEAQAA